MLFIIRGFETENDVNKFVLSLQDLTLMAYVSVGHEFGRMEWAK